MGTILVIVALGIAVAGLIYWLLLGGDRHRD